MSSIFTRSSLLLVVFGILAMAFHAHAAVEFRIQKTLQTDAAPIDVAVTADGRSTFVLTENGHVLVYDARGNLTETINIGSHIDRIDLDPRGERLFASSRRNKTVEIIQLDFIKKIDTEGAMFKGPANAPVTIAVFSEFQ